MGKGNGKKKRRGKGKEVAKRKRAVQWREYRESDVKEVGYGAGNRCRKVDGSGKRSSD